MPEIMLDWRRQRRWRKLPPGPLKDYHAQPLPSARADYRAVEYLALDLETTGLQPARDRILSFGWVLLDGTRIDLASAEHRLVRVDRAIPAASAVIHQITDDQAAGGETIDQALAALLAALAGRVLIAHHARIEYGFLRAACRRLYGQTPLLRVIDTQLLARRSLERRQLAFKAADLRLHALATRYNLPRARAHNALGDALNAAQLFLAQVAYQDPGGGLPLGDLLWR